MSTVLQEYRLYEELLRINNDEYYQIDFKTEQLIEVFTAIKDHVDYSRDRSCQFYLINLKTTNQKDVYLVFKWLLVTHKVLQQPLYFKVLENILKAIEKMGNPVLNTTFDKYFHESLLKVYSMYLQKLCLYKLKVELSSHYNRPNWPT